MVALSPSLPFLPRAVCLVQSVLAYWGAVAGLGARRTYCSRHPEGAGIYCRNIASLSFSLSLPPPPTHPRPPAPDDSRHVFLQ